MAKRCHTLWRLNARCSSARRDVAFALVEHLHVAAERNRGDHPFGLVRARAPRDERPAEADREAQHLHAAQRARRGSGRTRGRRSARRARRGRRRRSCMSAHARASREHAGAARGARAPARRRASTAVERSVARRGAARASSVSCDDACDAGEAAAVRRGTPRPPLRWRRSAPPARCRRARSASQARRRHGKRALVGRSKVRPSSVVEVERRDARLDALGPGQRVARSARACRGAELREHRAVDVLDHRMDDALRMDHHLDRARAAAPNSQRASITSRPLFIIVAESTEILRPITQFGCAQACVGRDVARASSGARRGTGRPRRSAGCGRRAPCQVARSSRQALEDRVVLAVDRQQRRAALRARRRMNSAPPITSASLLASSRRLPARAAARRRRAGRRRRRSPPSRRRRPDARRPRSSAAAPHSTSVSAALARSARRSARRCGRARQHRVARAVQRGTARAARRPLLCAVSATTSKRSGWRATTSSVLRRPSRSRRGSRRVACVARSAEGQQQRRERQRRGSSASMRSRTPPWPGSSAAAVLDAGAALDQRFEQVADDADARRARRSASERATRAQATRSAASRARRSDDA